MLSSSQLSNSLLSHRLRRWPKEAQSLLCQMKRQRTPSLMREAGSIMSDEANSTASASSASMMPMMLMLKMQQQQQMQQQQMLQAFRQSQMEF
jgi:hypothetical protein